MKVFSLMILSLFFSSCSNAQVSKESKEESKFEIVKSNDEWKALLGIEAFHVLREAGTERAFSGKYVQNKAKGTYHCAACSNALFSSDTKFKSGTGWPSFYNQISPNAILNIIDNSYGMQRTEIVCSRCGGHLGHVFNDGPAPTGLRYCVNSLSLNFVAADSTSTK